jgi:hypothetical protein
MHSSEAENHAREIARLQALAEGDPGSSVFPALAEAHRLAGRPDEAERIARAGLERCPDRVAGRVALGLALLDGGRLDEARWELQAVLRAVPDQVLAREALGQCESSGEPARSFEAEPAGEPGAFGPIEEAELDDALQAAVPDLDQTVDADRIAQEAMHQAELERPEGLISCSDSPFATRTVAALLEQQGDARGAQAIRSALEEGEKAAEPARTQPRPPSPASERRTQWIETLERWLHNVRRGRS